MKRLIITLGFVFATLAQAQTVFPYHASQDRKKQIIGGYESITKGMTLPQVEAALGKADYVTPLYEPKVKNASQIGFSHWFLIQQLKETGSVVDTGRVGVAIRTDMKGSVLGVDLFDLAISALAGSPPEDRCILPPSPPYVYYDRSPGISSQKELAPSIVSELQTLLANNLKRLPKPANLSNPGGPPIRPERVIQIVDSNGKDHSQVLLLRGLLLYNSEYASKDANVIAKFSRLLSAQKKAQKLAH